MSFWFYYWLVSTCCLFAMFYFHRKSINREKSWQKLFYDSLEENSKLNREIFRLYARINNLKNSLKRLQ